MWKVVDLPWFSAAGTERTWIRDLERLGDELIAVRRSGGGSVSDLRAAAPASRSTSRPAPSAP